MTFVNKKTKQKIIIPDHGSKKIGKGLLNKIIKDDIKLTRKEFFNLINK